MVCVHECKVQFQNHYCLSIYLTLNTVRKKKMVLKIHVFIQISSHGTTISLYNMQTSHVAF